MSHLYSTAYIDAQYEEGQYCGDEGPAYTAFGSAQYPDYSSEDADFFAFVAYMEGDHEEGDFWKDLADALWMEGL